MFKHAVSVALLLPSLLVTCGAHAEAEAEQRGPMRVYSVPGEFEEVRDTLQENIINQGIVISNVLHAGDMLNRTAADLGVTNNVYLHAETFEFCKAALSHELVALDPANMMACPYAIGVYVLAQQPDTVWLAYRRPQGVVGSESLTDRIEALLKTIIEETLAFL